MSAKLLRASGKKSYNQHQNREESEKNQLRTDKLRNAMRKTLCFGLRFVPVDSNLLILHVLLVPYS